MIYKIHGNMLCDALVHGARLIMFSFDGQYALIRSDHIVDSYLEKYLESELDIVTADSLYTQPCKDC